MSNRYIRAKERNRLSPSELQLLTYLVDGLALKKVAGMLGKSQRTVSCQKQSLLRITGSRNQVQLGIWALRNGYATSAELMARADQVAAEADRAGI